MPNVSNVLVVICQVMSSHLSSHVKSCQVMSSKKKKKKKLFNV